jgi:hypothetical protein
MLWNISTPTGNGISGGITFRESLIDCLAGLMWRRAAASRVHASQLCCSA